MANATIAVQPRRALNVVGPKYIALPAPVTGWVVEDAYGVVVGEYLSKRGCERAALRLNASVARAQLFGNRGPVAECVGDDHPHSADISSPTPTISEPGPTAEDLDGYVDVLEGLDDDGPSDQDFAEFGQWAEGLRADQGEPDYEEQELSEMGVRLHLDVMA